METPLISRAGGTMPRRRVALAVAGASALAAVALVALVVQRGAGPAVLLNKVPTYYMPKARLNHRAKKHVPEIVEMKDPNTGQPVYYMPVKNALKVHMPPRRATKRKQARA